MSIGAMHAPGNVLQAVIATLWLAWAAPAHAVSFELRQAVRTLDGQSQTVSLPDSVSLAEGAAEPLRASYRMSLDLPGAPHRLAVFVPGLIAHDRILFNGRVIDDHMADPMAPLPRSIHRIRYIEVAQEFVRTGTNIIEIEAAGRNFVSMSPVNVGDTASLGDRFERRVAGAVLGPAAVALVVGTLALCVLLIWARTRDSLYGYFGLGTLGWSLHDAWTVLPIAVMTPAHRVVWWTSLYSFFVAMLVIFCIRFAGWRWPRFERMLCVLAFSAPVVLYAAEAAGLGDSAQPGWLLLWIAFVAVGFAAVGHYVWRHRDTSGALLVLTGGVSLAFAIRDWLVTNSGEDNNPVFLVPYAGLMFVVLVAWMLIDRFVATSRAAETMNRELERRVSAGSEQLVKALAQMRSSKEVAESAARAKSTFLAAASHDLRQPIHALGLYLAALADDRLGRPQREIASRMTATLTTLETMLNALLDVSRMDAGAIVKRPRSFALAPLLHRLADEYAKAAAERGLRLSVRIAPGTEGVYAMSDPMLVERIVLNLLGNAVKYTREGGVLLSCRLRDQDRHWRLEVWDTGPGIAAKDRERVFEEFYQVGNPERDRTQGLGLGLSIVRRLTALLGHPLRLDSRVGRGSRFAIDLPATTEQPRTMQVETEPSPIGALHVAIVDDDPEVRESTRTLLERWGCRVYAGSDANDVLASVAATPGGTLQAIVADYRLRGDLTGIDAVHALRAAFGDALPALIVSGESSAEQLGRMRASGFDCRAKPVDPMHLRRWLAAAASAAQEPAVAA